MTPGPATRTARELPRKSPVPIAPPIAIMLSCGTVSWRESFSLFSICVSVVFIGRARTARRMKHAQQPNRLRTRIFQTMQHTIGEVNARPRPKLARRHSPVQMQNPPPFQDEDPFLIMMQMERSLTLRNPACELRHLLAASIGVDQITKNPVLSRA